MIDLHTHTVYSDGELIPAELVRRAYHAGYKGIAVTDHADPSNMLFILENIGRMIKKYGHFFEIDVLPGVELTHVPPALIRELVPEAREAGAKVVVVHGETVVEPVARGTNLAAIEAGVDILAHPGLITEEEAALAAEKGVMLEISTRKGHSLCNGLVAAMARKHGAKLVIDNDAHAPGDLIPLSLRKAVAYGAGLTPEEYERAEANSCEFFQTMLRK